MVKTQGWPVDQFRALLDHILDETGLTQAGLAALIPMDQSQLSRWKTGRSRPRFESLASLGLSIRSRYPALNVGPDELVQAAGYSVDATAHSPPVQIAPSSPRGGRKSDTLRDLVDIWEDDRETLIRNQQVLAEMVRALERDRDAMREEIRALRTSLAGLTGERQAESA